MIPDIPAAIGKTKILKLDLSNTFQSWAIGDNDGNLYIGVNQNKANVSIVYTNFLKERSDIT